MERMGPWPWLQDRSLTKMGSFSKVTSLDLRVCKIIKKNHLNKRSSLSKTDSDLISVLSTSARVACGAVLQPPPLLGSRTPATRSSSRRAARGSKASPAACSGPWKDSQPQVLGRCLLAPWGWGAGRLTSVECFYCWTN